MRLSIDARLDYTLAAEADLLFALEVAQLDDQRLVTDRLTVSGADALRPIAGEDGVGQRTWASAAGRIVVHYTATVDVDRPAPVLAGRGAGRLHNLPAGVIQYLFPSRYCEADRLEPVVRSQFGELAGGDAIAAMADWIGNHVEYAAGASDANITAADTYLSRRGVCRDFAHLLIAMARAAGVPARMVGAYALGLEPQDFHALAEVWLDGAWHLVDATGLAPTDGVVRIAVGRDATDISFFTIFGQALMNAQEVRVDRVEG